MQYGANYYFIFLVLHEDSHKSSFIYTLKQILPWTKNRIRKGCTKKMLYRRLPILNWLPNYNLSWAAGDLIAGITVGLTLIPQVGKILIYMNRFKTITKTKPNFLSFFRRYNYIVGIQSKRF